MSCDSFRFLLVRTCASGAAEIVSQSDDEEEIGRMWLKLKDCEHVGEYRYDIYKLY